jgi:hypothetical protein
MASRYAALSGRGLAAASDPELYQFALNYAQAHAMGTPQGVAGAGTTLGLPAFAHPVRLELGRGQAAAATALERRKTLALSLARRTTESSRKRALQRILSGYGVGLA